MSIKRFENEELGLSVETYVDYRGDIWFRGRDIANNLGYENTKDALIKHVRNKHKTIYEAITRGSRNATPLNMDCKAIKTQNEQPHTVYISEPGGL